MEYTSPAVPAPPRKKAARINRLLSVVAAPSSVVPVAAIAA
jgi:hypothetical protein